MKGFSKNILLLLLTVHVSSETILLKGGLVHLGNGEPATPKDILIIYQTEMLQSFQKLQEQQEM